MACDNDGEGYQREGKTYVTIIFILIIILCCGHQESQLCIASRQERDRALLAGGLVFCTPRCPAHRILHE